MNVVLDNARVLENFVVSATKFVDEANLVFSSDGLRVRQTDPSQIALFEFFLPKSAFKHFDVKETVTFGLDLDQLVHLLNGKANSELSIELVEDGSKVLFSFFGAINSTQKIPTIEVVSELPEPVISFDGYVTILAKDLKSSFKEAKKVSSHVVLVLGKDFVVSAKSGVGEINTIFGLKEQTVLDSKVVKAVGSMYPINYLVDLVSPKWMTSIGIKLNLKTNAPLKAEWLEGKAEYSFYLAPRIEDGEESPAEKIVREDFEQAVQKEETEPAQTVETIQEKPTETDHLASYEYSKPEPTIEPAIKAEPVKRVRSKLVKPVVMVRAKEKPVETKTDSLEINFVLKDKRLIEFIESDKKNYRDLTEQITTYLRNEKYMIEAEEKEG